MADPVTDVIDALKTLILAVPSVEQNLVHVYDEDDLVDFKRDLGFPLVGIAYGGMVGNSDSSRLGTVATISIDILIIGGDQATDKVDDLKPMTLSILNDIRQALVCQKFVRAGGGGQRKWTFVRELPVNIDEKLLAYLQSWTTTVVLNNA